MASQSVGASGSYGANTVTTTAEVLAVANATRTSILVQNLHATNDLYVGLDDQVTSSNGIKVAAGQSMQLDDYIGDVYVIASAASTDVRYLEIG